MYPHCPVRRSAVAILSLLSILAVAAPALAQPPFLTRTIDKSTSNIGSYASIAIDHLGRVHVSYWDGANSDLEYALKSGATWEFETVDGALSSVGSYTSIAVDQAGDPHISYYSLSTANLMYATKSGGAWTIETADASANSVGTWTSIALEPDGTPVIVYYDNTAADLKLASKPSGTWFANTIWSTGAIGTNTSIAIDADGVYHISFHDITNGSLQYMRRSKNVSSSPITVDNSALIVGWYTSIAVDNLGTPYISYYDATNDDLKFAYKPETSWVVETADATGNVGEYTSIAIDENHKAHISYLNQTYDDLKYATRTSGGFWTIETVDPDFNPGFWTGIALDRFGNPHIVHYDNFLDELKYTHTSLELTSPNGGSVWPVGSERTIEWNGIGWIYVYLSVDGGSSYDLLASNVTDDANPGGGTYLLRVPHTPSRFCKVKLTRSSYFTEAVSDSFFSIEADIVLLGLSVEPAVELSGNRITWETNPAPEDLGGYRLERERPGEGVTELASLLKQTTYHDASGLPSDRYRLYAVNGLGEEYYLGEAESRITLAPGEGLRLWPTPYRGGALNIAFATSGGFGGGVGRTTVTIYDVAGRRVREVSSGEFLPGYRTTTWDGLNEKGQAVASGIYFVKSEGLTGTLATQKLVIVR